MGQHRGMQQRAETVVEGRASRAHQVVGQQQVHGADSHVHGAGPVHAEARRIVRDPVEHLVAEFRRQPRVTRFGIGQGEFRQVLQA